MIAFLKSSRSRAVCLRAAGLGAFLAALAIGTDSRASDTARDIVAQELSPRSGPRGTTMFARLSPEATGLVAENRYADPRMWGERFREFEVGAVDSGVAVGDYDGDGRPDIFVVGKTDSCRLFRNLGNWKFEDVTDRAGVGDKGDAALVWKQGASFVDVNNDGRLDLYVCRFGAPNLLYLNQGDGTFKEEAAVRGLAVNDASVMAAFCDYDRDGWLDAFVQTNALDTIQHPNGQRDYLFHNNGNGTFSDVTIPAGITGEAQGHSATWWDFDHDGWPDLYVANDFAGPDKLYRNNRDGTFANVIDRVVPHLPYSAMGSDLGDVNNDGLMDLFVSEMAATSHQKDQRTMAASRSLISEDPSGKSGPPQYFRNALYLNTGTGRCQEAAFLAGLDATDWTWAVRFEDLDNDGRLDLFATNGMHRESHNVDLMARETLAATPAEKIRIERASPMLAEPNVAYRNLGDLRFQEVGVAWGLAQKGVSYGAAFGDLDGDGDLDLVFTNYQGGLTVLRNDSDTGHRAIFALEGTHSNRFGVGATVRIETGSGVQVRQLVLARGVVSSSEPILHFGLGNDSRLKRVTVEWPSGQKQVFTDLPVDRKFTITEPSGPAGRTDASKARLPAQFSEVSQDAGLSLRSRERPLDELGQQPLLPIRQNRRGPALAVGDIDGDGRDDVVLGGTPADPLRILLWSADGSRFVTSDASALAGDGLVSDGPILIFDADGNGSNDLLVTKGGSARPAGSAEYQPRLFFNDGHGAFRPAPADALPPLAISAGAVAAADFDRDGRLDLFVGGRVAPGLYPLAPKSALLINRGGRFEDVTDTLAPALRAIGMVTSAVWSDLDGDGWPDLLVALEWGNVRYFHNRTGHGFEDWTERAGFSSAGTGWWNSLAEADFNGDGRPDFVAGNLGLNTQYRADAGHPALLFVGDFNDDGGSELVEAYYEGDRLYPWRTRKDLGAAIPAILKKYPRNDYYARATLQEILGEKKLAAAQRFAATEFRSGVFLSRPDGGYRFEPLPRLAQIAPIQGVVAGDFDGDGHADIYAVQNSYAPIPAVGRFDGGLSQLLRGDGQGHFAVVPPAESGLLVPGDAKALAVAALGADGWPGFIVTRNDDTVLAFQNHRVAHRHELCIRLQGPPGNPTAAGGRVVLTLSDGSAQARELHAGSGYLSQSSPALFFGWRDELSPRRIEARWPDGTVTAREVDPSVTTIVVTANKR